MSKTQLEEGIELWKKVREMTDVPSITLGPFYSEQIASGALIRTLARYKFVANLTEGKNVLEIGCGEGLGTFLLSKKAKYVLGIDFDSRAIEWAREHFTRDNCKFMDYDLIREKKELPIFDAVVSTDVIEHISKRDENKFMKRVCSQLDEEGFCVIGTPNKNMAKYSSKQSQKGHVNMYDHGMLEGLVKRFFHNVFTFGMNDEAVYTGFKPMCQYLMAIGCNKK